MDKKQWKKLLRENTLNEDIYERFDWPYYYLRNGKLVDEDGYELNKNNPKFKSIEDAEEFLKKMDIRGNVVGKWSRNLPK